MKVKKKRTRKTYKTSWGAHVNRLDKGLSQKDARRLFWMSLERGGIHMRF